MSSSRLVAEVNEVDKAERLLDRRYEENPVVDVVDVADDRAEVDDECLSVMEDFLITVEEFLLLLPPVGVGGFEVNGELPPRLLRLVFFTS